jgi:glycosyltransferase involved in cell wall biosynthesis
MPRDLKRQYGGLRGIHIIDKTVPWAEMERIFTSADIFLFPAHCSQDLVVLDAMSFELPVVISDLMANGEVVEDGKTGLLIRPSRTVPCFLDDMVPSSGTTAFERAIRKVDPGMLEETVEKTSILVGNEALRRKLGKAGRWEIENGKFSVQQRNRTLKELFDRATS